MLFELILAIFFHITRIYTQRADSVCSPPYSHCELGKPGMINVHIVPHTHDDVGWLKTVDQYYYGSHYSYQDAKVQTIIDSVITELIKDPKRRFIYVEMAFFWRWWQEQNNDMKLVVRKLVDEKRLEFVIGAWSMNDEATTYYQDIIDQQTLGLQFILREFGECAVPKVGWQIDPFGHSREYASLMAHFGFDGLFHGRVDYQDLEYRAKHKTKEMIWKASSSLGKSAEIFTGILPNVYWPPTGFCFDQLCHDDPIMDNPTLSGYNVEEKVNEFIRLTLEQRESYKTDNLIMTMGNDFHYSNALLWYKNLDKLILHVNAKQVNGSKVNIFYSTPACYLYSLYKANEAWTVKTDDFFPYSHNSNGFWTGYFTSRPNLKDYVRRTNNFLQVVRQLSAFARLSDAATDDCLFQLSEAMGILQHHDAITGTEKQHVADDYAKRLSIGVDMCLPVFNNAYLKLIKQNSNFDYGNRFETHYCPLLNITECLPIENADDFAVIVYNPLGKYINTFIRVPVSSKNYSVIDVDTNKRIFIDYCFINDPIKNIAGRVSIADSEILFKASVGPFGFSVYRFSVLNNNFKSKARRPKGGNLNTSFIISNDILRVKFDSDGNLMEIQNMNTNLTTKINQTMCYYRTTSSGAYLFRPQGEALCYRVKSYTLTSGKYYAEIHQVFGEWMSQTIRLYQGSNRLTFNWVVGPINVRDNVAKEIITRFDSDIESNATFYTDSNGREILKRIRDYRPTWPFDPVAPIASNYYPVNSRIFIRDKKDNRQLTLVTDRSQGGSSLFDGSLELMLHRRLMYDEGLGLSEPLVEPGISGNGIVATGTYHLLFDTAERSTKQHRELSHEVNMQPLLTFSLLKNDAHHEQVKQLSSFKTLLQPLPDNVHLLTLSKDFMFNNQNTLILRLEHFYELNEDPVLSQPVTIDLAELLSPSFRVVDIKELALGANMDVDQLSQRLYFNNDRKPIQNDPLVGFRITLQPMQIRTFRVYYENNAAFSFHSLD